MPSFKRLLTGALMTLLLGAAGTAVAGTPATPPQKGEPSDIVPVIPDPLSGKEEQVTRLANGLSVLILKDTRFPLVSTRLYVHAGSAYENPDQAGISHVLEHMVFKGTDSRPKSAISQDVESAGGYLNAATSYDYTVYITDMPARHWKLGMDVVRDMAFHATLDAQELESEKNVVVSELQRGEDNPGSRMFKTLLAKALRGTPYERPVIGYEKTIRGLTVQNLRDYIAKYYQPQNMLLVVVGNIEPAEVLTEAERQFAPYKNTSPLREVLPYEADRLPLPGSGPMLTVQPGPWNKVYLAAALPVPGIARATRVHHARRAGPPAGRRLTAPAVCTAPASTNVSSWTASAFLRRELRAHRRVRGHGRTRRGQGPALLERPRRGFCRRSRPTPFPRTNWNAPKLNIEDDLYRFQGDAGRAGLRNSSATSSSFRAANRASATPSKPCATWTPPCSGSRWKRGCAPSA